MSDVEFNEEQFTQQTQVPRNKEAKGLYKLVIDWGLAKDESGARMILIVAIIILLGIAIAYPIIFG